MSTDTYTELVTCYRAHFHDSPPAYLFFELDFEEGIERLQHSLRSGEKLPDLIPPDGVVV